MDLDSFDEATNYNTHLAHVNCLVGKLFSDKSANSFAIMEVMKKAWKAKKGLEAREWTHNLFLFSFKDNSELKWVVKNQPWHFEGNLFLIRPLENSEQPSKILITEAQLWLRVYDAPVSYMRASVAQAIARKVGNLICVDPAQDRFGKYLRIKVGINVSKPQVFRFWLVGRNYGCPLNMKPSHSSATIAI